MLQRQQMMLPKIKALFAAAIALLFGGLAVSLLGNPSASDRQRLGLMTSLPIYWSEVGDLGELLGPNPNSGDDDAAGQHWVRTALEEEYMLVPLDSLHQGNDGAVSSELTGLKLLILAQPHTLVPLDNVALDNWVKGGGRLLMFSDPMLTEHSRFGIGDKRRPQDIGLIPPVFARWGLTQSFADGQSQQGEIISAANTQIAVVQRGSFALLPQNGGQGADCVISGEGLIAECQLGKGRVLLIGDAALLDPRNDPDGEAALNAIIRDAFLD